jgi:hypothetical protein
MLTRAVNRVEAACAVRASAKDDRVAEPDGRVVRARVAYPARVDRRAASYWGFRGSSRGPVYGLGPRGPSACAGRAAKVFLVYPLLRGLRRVWRCQCSFFTRVGGGL